MNNKEISPKMHLFPFLESVSEIASIIVLDKDGNKRQVKVSNFIEGFEQLIEATLSDKLSKHKEEMNKITKDIENKQRRTINIKRNKIIEKKEAKEGDIYYVDGSIRVFNGNKWNNI